LPNTANSVQTGGYGYFTGDVSQIIRGKRAVSADTALRLARYFGTTPEFWLGMQASYDLALARDLKGAEIEASVAPRAA
jgi:plasmid maintenance system antidote protein VapI